MQMNKPSEQENIPKTYKPSVQVIKLVKSVESLILKEYRTRNLIALAVVGSAGRGEETWLDGNLIGDIDLAAVVAYPNLLTPKRFDKIGLSLNIDLGFFPLYSLKRYLTLEFYEAKHTAWVFWGKTDVFDCVRLDQPSDIPKWEGLRLLLNRSMECIKARTKLIPTWYAAVKTFLALGEAELIFNECYESTYQNRWERLKISGEILGSRELFEKFEWATRIKLGMVTQPIPCEQNLHEKWLIIGLTQLLSRYLGENVSVEKGLEIVSRRTVHPLHRIVHLLQNKKSIKPWLEALSSDPIFPIWNRAIQVLSNQMVLTDDELMSMVTDWEGTYQPLPTKQTK
jgi:hypothetical protein